VRVTRPSELTIALVRVVKTREPSTFTGGFGAVTGIARRRPCLMRFRWTKKITERKQRIIQVMLLSLSTRSAFAAQPAHSHRRYLPCFLPLDAPEIICGHWPRICNIVPRRQSAPMGLSQSDCKIRIHRRLTWP